MKEKTYKDYTLNEKIIYAKAWNAAIETAAKHVELYDKWFAKEIRKLDKSIQACDD